MLIIHTYSDAFIIKIYGFKSRHKKWVKMCVLWSVKLFKCDPLCEIQAKVLKSNNEISIKIWFLPLKSLSFQSFIWSYSVNINDIKCKMFTECPLPYEGWFFGRKQQITKRKYFSLVFTERVTNYPCSDGAAQGRWAGCTSHKSPSWCLACIMWKL